MVLTHHQSIRARVRQSTTIREAGGLVTLAFFAMGTRCQVMFANSSLEQSRVFGEQLLNLVADFEAKYSRFLDDSLISLINAAAGKDWVEVDEETDRIFSLCGDLFFFTRGAFDPTALPLIRLWNWKANPPVVPDEDAIRTARELVGWNKVQRRRGAIFLTQPGMALDLGGIGKEYAVDMTMALAAQFGIENVLVDFGQDIRVQGKPPGRPAWHVGLENPRNPGSCWASVAVTNHAVASSGDYLRHFVHQGRRYGHIIDPRTGYPVDHDCRPGRVVGPTFSVSGYLNTSGLHHGSRG